ncbi:MAG TPA: S-layer homology domain-containing protein, partial [Candidatus Scatomorpha stercoravium]|nr:S-layer homology domain-containing protein [Candidatus Scatomorpha stercoravium]
TFAPYVNMNRAMLVTMLYRLDGEQEVEGKVSEVFTDCADGEYYSDAVLWASQNEIVKGRSETTYDPFANMTRQEMATVLYRYCLYKGAEEVAEPELEYTDAASIADWAGAAVAYCAESGLMEGVDGGAFNPNGSANRAMGATVLARLAGLDEAA